jgi:predicted nucleotidyltransferase
VNPRDPNIAKVELVAHALGDLCEELVFVGGCAAGLLITDTAAAPVRVTYDVDLVVEVTALSGYHRMEKQFTKLGFTRDMASDAPICRWRYQNLEVDLMPTDSAILGFANRWYPLVVETAEKLTLPSGARIRLITAPAFVATKFEAFNDRGNGDVLGSHDLEDIITVIDGRTTIFDEIGNSAPPLRAYLGDQFRTLLNMPNFIDYLPGMLFPDASLAERLVLLSARLQALAKLR